MCACKTVPPCHSNRAPIINQPLPTTKSPSKKAADYDLHSSTADASRRRCPPRLPRVSRHRTMTLAESSPNCERHPASELRPVHWSHLPGRPRTYRPESGVVLTDKKIRAGPRALLRFAKTRVSPSPKNSSALATYRKNSPSGNFDLCHQTTPKPLILSSRSELTIESLDHAGDERKKKGL